MNRNCTAREGDYDRKYFTPVSMTSSFNTVCHLSELIKQNSEPLISIELGRFCSRIDEKSILLLHNTCNYYFIKSFSYLAIFCDFQDSWSAAATEFCCFIAALTSRLSKLYSYLLDCETFAHIHWTRNTLATLVATNKKPRIIRSMMQNVEKLKEQVIEEVN